MGMRIYRLPLFVSVAAGLVLVEAQPRDWSAVPPGPVSSRAGSSAQCCIQKIDDSVKTGKCVNATCLHEDTGDGWFPCQTQELASTEVSSSATLPMAVSAAAAAARTALAVHRARFLEFKPKRVTCLAASPSNKLLAVSYSTAEVAIFRIVDSAHLVPVLVRGPAAEIACRTPAVLLPERWAHCCHVRRACRDPRTPV